jgi:hypothetical protein
MTDPRTRARLVEQAAGAWRPTRGDGGVGSLPAWHDLDEAGRRAAFEAARRSRRLEAALDPDGLSSTGRAVLARIRGHDPA